MSPELRAALRLVLEAYPAGSTVPVLREHALELLQASGSADVCTGSVDLTVAEAASRFGRRPSTLRSWCEAGRFPGAYKLHGNREWRIPPAAIDAFQAGEREGSGRGRASSGKAVDLSTWRRSAS